MSKAYCVYKHTCPNGKVYIGITRQNPIKRWKGGSGYKENKHFYSAILKYGWVNIKHEILYDELNEEQACVKEVELISKYNSNDREFGYNNSTGGEKNFTFSHSSETKERMRKCKRTNQHNVLQIDINTGQCIAKYISTMEAERQTGISHVSINYCCLGKRKTSGGYMWQYEDKPIEYNPEYTRLMNNRKKEEL